MFASNSPSLNFVAMYMERRLGVIPDIWTEVVDVRDVAEAALRSLLVPEAVGRRFVLVGEVINYQQIGALLYAKWPEHNVPT